MLSVLQITKYGSDLSGCLGSVMMMLLVATMAMAPATALPAFGLAPAEICLVLGYSMNC